MDGPVLRAAHSLRARACNYGLITSKLNNSKSADVVLFKRFRRHVTNLSTNVCQAIDRLWISNASYAPIGFFLV